MVKNKQPSQRQLRVGEALRHALSDVLERGNLRDPAFRNISITVTEVRASPDLKNATAFVMPLGGEAADAIVEALGRAAPFLRSAIAKQVELRHVPRLQFKVDRSFGQADHIDALLRQPQVARDLGENTGES
ncbi:MAG: ribosome-binding factor A [Rhodospirillaceae bacterium]|nr:ribosome-binding factor A [Rhodospirillaceae bacterium]